MSLELKLRHEKRGDHVHTTVFARWIGSGETFANLGTLVTDVGQYQLLWAAVGLGAPLMRGHIQMLPDEGWDPSVLTEGERG